MPTDDDRALGDDPSPEDTVTSSESDAVGASFESTDAPLESFGEVVSVAMDQHDPDTTGELDLPGVNENLNPHPAGDDPGFDGWLDDDETSAKSEDPYAALSGPEEEDHAASEIADWMAFTSAANDEPSVSDEGEAVGDVTDRAESEEGAPEVEPGDPIQEDPDDDDPHEDTVELFLGDSMAEQAADEDDEPSDDPGEEPIDIEPEGPDDELGHAEEPVAADEPSAEAGEAAEADREDSTASPTVPMGIAAMGSDGGPDTDSGEADDDTGEIPIVGLVKPGIESEAGSGVFDVESLTEEHYLDAATREHHDLAAAIAVAESEDTEQVALSAAIPGLDSGVVGFGDVVDSHAGDASTPIAPPKSSDLVLRVVTGATLIVAFLLSLLWRPAIIVLALAVFVIAAGEFYSVLIHRKYKPLSIFGFLGVIGAGLGAVVWGVVAIPIAFALMIIVILLYDAVSRRRQGAVNGFSLTILVAVWIGGFGAFAFPIIAADNYQALVLTVVAMVALVDIAAYFVGSTIGRRPLAPVISPKKTIEGFIGGTLMALLAGAVVSFFFEALDLPAGLTLGVVVAVFAPLGDLSVSVVKRSLNIKDMGSILPGHGGLLDRVDAIIAVVPAAWAVFLWMGLL